jgi:RNA polymerase-binding transcription factor DksA
MPLSDKQRKHLEKRLLEERERVRRDLQRFATGEEDEDQQDRTGNLSKVPFHPADLGTENFDQELDASNASRQTRELEEIDAALERMYAHPERFGIDERTGREIPFARLDVIPWARTDASG